MYPVSQAYINKITDKTATASWSGTITPVNGTTHTFTNSDLVQGQTRLTYQTSGGDEIELGSTCVSQLDLGIYLDIDRYSLMGATLTLDFRLHYDDGVRVG